MTDLPERITRPCCPRKSCRETLHLVDNGSPPGWPLLYDYVRGNGTSYGMGWYTEEALQDWLKETE